LGLGWLAWSIRKDTRARRFGASTPVRSRLSATLQTRGAPVRTEATVRDGRYEEPYRTRDLPLSGATTSGEKLMGVRVRDKGYEG